MMGERIQTPLYAGHHWPASETPFKWRFAGVPLMAQHRMLAWQLCDFEGNRTSMLRNPIFQGWGLSPSGIAHELSGMKRQFL